MYGSGPILIKNNTFKVDCMCCPLVVGSNGGFTFGPIKSYKEFIKLVIS